MGQKQEILSKYLSGNSTDYSALLEKEKRKTLDMLICQTMDELNKLIKTSTLDETAKLMEEYIQEKDAIEEYFNSLIITNEEKTVTRSKPKNINWSEPVNYSKIPVKNKVPLSTQK